MSSTRTRPLNPTWTENHPVYGGLLIDDRSKKKKQALKLKPQDIKAGKQRPAQKESEGQNKGAPKAKIRKREHEYALDCHYTLLVMVFNQLANL